MHWEASLQSVKSPHSDISSWSQRSTAPSMFYTPLHDTGHSSHIPESPDPAPTLCSCSPPHVPPPIPCPRRERIYCGISPDCERSPAAWRRPVRSRSADTVSDHRFRCNHIHRKCCPHITQSPHPDHSAVSAKIPAKFPPCGPPAFPSPESWYDTPAMPFYRKHRSYIG